MLNMESTQDVDKHKERKIPCSFWLQALPWWRKI